MSHVLFPLHAKLYIINACHTLKATQYLSTDYMYYMYLTGRGPGAGHAGGLSDVRLYGFMK